MQTSKAEHQYTRFGSHFLRRQNEHLEVLADGEATEGILAGLLRETGLDQVPEEVQYHFPFLVEFATFANLHSRFCADGGTSEDVVKCAVGQALHEIAVLVGQRNGEGEQPRLHRGQFTDRGFFG